MVDIVCANCKLLSIKHMLNLDTLTYIRLDDPNYSPVINSLPIDGIVNYLFSHNLTIKVKRLSINRHVGIPLNDQQCQYMVEEIKKVTKYQYFSY